MEGVNGSANFTAVYGYAKQACEQMFSKGAFDCEQVAQRTDFLWEKTRDAGVYLFEGVKSVPGFVYGIYSDLGNAPYGSGPILQVFAIAATAWAIYDLTVRRDAETHYYDPNEVTVDNTRKT